MSKFLKALQRAEEERLLQEQPWRVENNSAPATLRPEQARPTPPIDIPPRPDAAKPQPNGVRTASAKTGAISPAAFPAPKDPEALASIDAHCVSLLQPLTFEAEQYRTLRYLVERAHNQNDNLRVVAISSPASGDGKTTTAINLAGALAQATDLRILLVDADLRQPSVARFLGLQSAEGPGLVDAILDPTLHLEDVIRPCPPFNLSLLAAGRPTTAAYEVFTAPRLGELLAQARHQYDYIVLDTPPLVPFPDCRLLAKWVDAFFVIVAAHKTSRKLVEEGLGVIDAAQLLGLVFNRDDRPLSRYGSNGSASFSLKGHSVGQRNGVRSRGGNFLRHGILSKTTTGKYFAGSEK